MTITLEALGVEVDNLKRRVEVLEKEISEVENKAATAAEAQAAISTKLNTVIENLGRVQQSIEDLKGRPGRRWETIISALIGAAATAFIAFILRG